MWEWREDNEIKRAGRGNALFSGKERRRERQDIMSTIRFTWWNLQNFFDTEDDPISEDFEFTAAKGWTPEVFAAKKAKLAEALRSTHNGEEIELLAVAEIEKDTLLEELIEAMGYQHLKVVMDPSGTSDLRGIDVAMAYDDRKLEVKGATSHVVHLRYRTRDIFEVSFTLKDTGEELVVIASHWPSRRLGKFESEPSRMTVAENIAFLVDEHVKVAPARYEQLRNSLQPEVALQEVKDKWETKVLVVGDFNDEPHDRSVIDHLLASHELDHVLGETNDIDRFKKETADYRGQAAFLFNATWKFLTQVKTSTFYFAGSLNTGTVTNRYQVLDQVVASRGLLAGNGLTLDLPSVAICHNKLVATREGRPRGFDRNKRTGTSDHLPVTAVLKY